MDWSVLFDDLFGGCFSGLACVLLREGFGRVVLGFDGREGYTYALGLVCLTRRGRSGVL